MKSTLLTFAAFFVIILLHAQDTISLKKEAQRNKIYTDRPPQAVFAELGGNAIVLSANYDRRFGKKTGGLGFRVGVGYSFSNDPGFFSIPVGLNYLLGKKSNFFEIGVGETALFVKSRSIDSWGSIGNTDLYDGDNVFITTINIGYRLQPVKGGFNFRAGLMPFFIKSETSLLPYLSFGYNF